jgi:hypothetical protein
MTQSIQEAVSGLQAARDAQAEVVAQEMAELQRLDNALAALTSTATVSAHSLRPQDMTNLGIVDATKKLLAEVGHELSTREIADAIRDRGVSTTSKNFVPTVYATLANAKDFTRKNGKWDLKTKGARQA